MEAIEAAYVVHAEPRDIERAQKIVNKVNGLPKKDRKDKEYDNYLEQKPQGALIFILN